MILTNNNTITNNTIKIDLLLRDNCIQPVSVINVEIKDNHEEASIGARQILQLCTMVFIIYYC